VSDTHNGAPFQRNFIGSQVVKGATSVSPGWRNPLAGA